jgi:hypothetical protein
MIREGLQLFRVHRVSAIERSVMRRARSQHATLVEKLHQHDGAYAMLDRNSAIPGASQPADALIALASLPINDGAAHVRPRPFRHGPILSIQCSGVFVSVLRRVRVGGFH